MNKFGSRKFLLTVIGAAMVGFNDLLGKPLDDNSLNNLVMLLVSYLVGQGAVDAVGKYKEK